MHDIAIAYQEALHILVLSRLGVEMQRPRRLLGERIAKATFCGSSTVAALSLLRAITLTDFSNGPPIHQLESLRGPSLDLHTGINEEAGSR